MSVGSMRACVLAGLGLLAAMAGCGPTQRDVVVSVDNELLANDQRIEVHMVAPNPHEHDYWAERSVTEYWDNPDNAADIHRMSFSPGQPNPQQLASGEPIWDVWLKGNQAEHLFVLASLPGKPDRPGSADARRLILPLDREQWSGSQAIPIWVTKDSIRIGRPPRR